MKVAVWFSTHQLALSSKHLGIYDKIIYNLAPSLYHRLSVMMCGLQAQGEITLGLHHQGRFPQTWESSLQSHGGYYTRWAVLTMSIKLSIMCKIHGVYLTKSWRMNQNNCVPIHLKKQTKCNSFFAKILYVSNHETCRNQTQLWAECIALHSFKILFIHFFIIY